MYRLRQVLILSALFGVGGLSVSATADAQIYRYENDDGTVVFTTERRSGEDAAEVYGEGDSTNSEGRVIADPPDRPNPNPDRNPDAFDDLIREAAETYDIPFEFIKAVIRVESAFDPHAISRVGAMGLMQLMPATAESLNCDDPFDPRQNIMAGTQYLRIMSNRYNGDINLVLSAYNAGSGAVARFDGIPYEATRRYIERVYEYYQEFLDDNAATAE